VPKGGGSVQAGYFALMNEAIRIVYTLHRGDVCRYIVAEERTVSESVQIGTCRSED